MFLLRVMQRPSLIMAAAAPDFWRGSLPAPISPLCVAFTVPSVSSPEARRLNKTQLSMQSSCVFSFLFCFPLFNKQENAAVFILSCSQEQEPSAPPAIPHSVTSVLTCWWLIHYLIRKNKIIISFDHGKWFIQLNVQGNCKWCKTLNLKLRNYQPLINGSFDKMM